MEVPCPSWLSVLISGRLIATATATATRVSFFTLIHLANITQCRATDEPRLAAFDPVSVLCLFCFFFVLLSR